MTRPAAVVGLATVGSLVLGGLVSFAAIYVARDGPSGSDWSFRGHGAITVYFAIPAVLAAGWTALAAHRARRSAWPAFGLGAGIVGLVLALLDAALVPLFGQRGDQFWSPLVSIAVLAWAVAAPLYVASNRVPGSALWHAIAAAVWVAGTLAGAVVAGVVAPAGS